ncbi:hypothetical protein [Salinarimonas sp.]|uniref:hypothetical protein n=1 Tax=Salinarimonas sp. TaxID=2766526 RepID=UPI0032D926EF
MTANSRSFVTAIAAALALVTAGCAGDLNPVRDVFVATGAGATPTPAPDFVEQSRAAAPTGYVPVARLPERETPAKTPEEIAALEAELVATRDDAEARAARLRRLAIGPAPEPVTVPPPVPIEGEVAPPPLPR